MLTIINLLTKANSMSKPLNILRYASDLHLEFHKDLAHPKLLSLWDFKKDFTNNTYLALTGDIGNPFHSNLVHFFEKINPVYKKIFYIPGNHEYYNLNYFSQKSCDEVNLELKNICSKFDNIILMNNTTFDLNGIKIIGSTLWSNISNKNKEYISNVMNDYQLIKKYDFTNTKLIPITVEETNQWNVESIDFLKKELSNEDQPCIVLTHHAPLFSNLLNNELTANKKYYNGKNNEAFHNDLTFLIKKPILAWIYGHTHHVSKFIKNDVIVATNQLGYESEQTNKTFDSFALLDLNELTSKNKLFKT